MTKLKYIIFKKLPQLGLNKADWELVQSIKAQGVEWSDWLREAIRIYAAIQRGEVKVKEVQK